MYKGERDLPLKDAIEKFFLPKGDDPAVHRVAIFDDDGKIEQVVSQMDVVRHMFGIASGSDWMKQTVKDAGAPQCVAWYQSARLAVTISLLAAHMQPNSTISQAFP